MSLNVLRLTASDRQWLHQIAKGRCWRRQAVEAGPAAARTRQPKAPRASRLDGAGEAQLL